MLIIPSGKDRKRADDWKFPTCWPSCCVVNRCTAPDAFLFGGTSGHRQAWMWEGLRRYCEKSSRYRRCVRTACAVFTPRWLSKRDAPAGSRRATGTRQLRRHRASLRSSGAIENTRIRKVSGLLATDPRFVAQPERQPTQRLSPSPTKVRYFPSSRRCLKRTWLLLAVLPTISDNATVGSSMLLLRRRLGWTGCQRAVQIAHRRLRRLWLLRFAPVEHLDAAKLTWVCPRCYQSSHSVRLGGLSPV